jgi:uncharacterized protein (DUF302 family)
MSASVSGMISLACQGSVAAVLERLERGIRARGMTIFAVIDHAAAATAAGLALRPTTLVIFGNPSAGTHLMQDTQEIGLDLPLRALLWTDAQEQTWLGYTDPTWLAQRYGLRSIDTIVAAMSKALRDLAEESARG